MAETKVQASYLRIASTDINANLPLLYGLSKIKGVGLPLANAICAVLGYDREIKISSLSEQDVEKIEKYLADPKKPGIPSWMLNMQKESESGENLHYMGKDIEFHVMQLKRRLKKLKTFKGLRLALGLTVRGQRTRSNFRRDKTIASMKAKGKKKD